jgi:hypothetical protein
VQSLENQVNQKKNEIISAIGKCLKLGAGVGLGLSIGVDVCDFVSAGAGIEYNLIDVSVDNGELSFSQTRSEGVDINVLGFPLVEKDSYSRGFPFDGSTGEWIRNDYDPNITIFSVGLYLFAGAYFYIGIDTIALTNELKKITIY